MRSLPQLAARCTALRRPMTNTALSRTEPARRCDIDDFVATALGVPNTALLLPLPSVSTDDRRGC